MLGTETVAGLSPLLVGENFTSGAAIGYHHAAKELRWPSGLLQRVEIRSAGQRKRSIWEFIMAMSLSSCVTLGELPNPSIELRL